MQKELGGGGLTMANSAGALKAASSKEKKEKEKLAGGRALKRMKMASPNSAEAARDGHAACNVPTHEESTRRPWRTPVSRHCLLLDVTVAN